MTFQAVVRDAQNEIVANQGVSVEVSITQTTTTGTVVFEESHSPTTNVNGLFTVVLGTGIPVSGSLSAIDWSQGQYSFVWLANQPYFFLASNHNFLRALSPVM